MMQISEHQVQGRKLVGVHLDGGRSCYSECGFIYFLVNFARKKTVKIGFSNNPLNRQNTLQTGSPTPCEIMHVIPGDRDVERSIHRHFADDKINGEWFMLTPQIENLILRRASLRQILSQ